MTQEDKFWLKVDVSGGPDACHTWIVVAQSVVDTYKARETPRIT